MKKSIEKCGIGGIKMLEYSLDPHNKKIIDNFVIMCGATAGKTTQAKLRRQMIKMWDLLEMDLDKITLKDLRAFLKLVNESDLMPATKNDLRKILKRFLKETYDDWSSRFKDLKDIRGEKEVNFERINADTIFSPKEIEMLIRGCDSLMYKALFMLMYESGGRPEEIAKLQWKDVKLDKNEVTLRSSKNGTLRINPVQNCIPHLKRYKLEYPFDKINQDDFVFPSPKNRERHISVPAIDAKLLNLGRIVLDRNIFPYLFRHTRGTELQKVLPPKVYEKFMDHSIQTATRYSHLNKDDVKDAMFKHIYKIEELTPQEKDEIKKLQSQVKDLYAALKSSNKVMKESNEAREEERKLFKTALAEMSFSVSEIQKKLSSS